MWEFSWSAVATALLALGAWGLRRRASCQRRRASFWAGKHVWITGASSGLGAALAEEVSRRGARVSLGARRAPLLAARVRDLERAGRQATACSVDVTDTDAVYAAYAASVERFGPVDVVVANAGVNHDGLHFKTLAAERVDTVLDTNLRGAIHTFRAALPDLLAREKPAYLVGVSSLAAYRGLPGGSVYGASKAGLTVFLESLRIELRGTAIRCVSIHPGFVHTPGINHLNHPKPLAVSAATAAGWMADAVADETAHFGFPWPMEHLLMNLARAAPTPLYDFIVSAAA